MLSRFSRAHLCLMLPWWSNVIAWVLLPFPSRRPTGLFTGLQRASSPSGKRHDTPRALGWLTGGIVRAQDLRAAGELCIVARCVVSPRLLRVGVRPCA